MQRPTRVVLYAVGALAIAYVVASIVGRLDPCTDLDSDCDVQGLGMLVWAGLAVAVVMPVVVAVTEAVAKHRGWDVKPGAGAPRTPA